MFSGRAVESTPIAREALRVAREVGALPEAAMSLGVLAWDQAMAGAVEAGVADLRDGLAIAESSDAAKASRSATSIFRHCWRPPGERMRR